MSSRGKEFSERPRKEVISPFDDEKRVCALVVDDDLVVRKVHSMYLNRHGVDNEMAQNGQEAVELFDSGKSFDLVLMDLEMPVMNGATATKELRAMGVKSMIVGVTGCGVEEEREAFVAAGLDGCLDKPLTGETVIDILDELAMRVF